MAALRVRSLHKRFGSVEVLKGIDLSIDNGEFIVLLGPSGCGKSTLLNIIAGLERASAGSIEIGDRVVDNVAPKDRDIAMVFQSYALYPAMTVRQNITFGMQCRGVPRAQQVEAVGRVAALLQIGELLDRKPAQLSGGQRQRVALGRAIVREPKVFLFDEPLSNLDAKLRVETRAELARLHRRLGATIVYVTHDQEEAMTLGSRVAVMRDGFLQQVAPPMELYRRPANRFVAGFVGSPAMNFLPREIAARAAPRIGVTLGVRPHDVAIVPRGEGDQDAWVDVVEPRGSELVVYLRLGADHEGPELRVVAPPEPAIEADRVVGVRFDPGRMHWFDDTSGSRVD
jgi:multiple sugar transport system ATP-binding protein